MWQCDISHFCFSAGYDLEDAGFLSVIPYIANFFSVMCFGWLFDYLQVSE
jgi:hypothetical protein